MKSHERRAAAMRRELAAAIRKRVEEKYPEPGKVVRQIAHKLGYRYRLHSDLPGKPYLLFPKHRKAILLGFTVQESRVKELEEIGWSVLVIQGSEVSDREALIFKIARFMR